MPTKYKLYYYSGKGRGEPVRMIFAMAGVEYEDVRFEHDEWLEKYKASMWQNQLYKGSLLKFMTKRGGF